MGTEGEDQFWAEGSWGARAWDIFMSLAGTTRKLGVNFYRYIQDRISGGNQISQLASIIKG